MEQLKRLIPYLAPHRWTIAMAILAMAGEALTTGIYALIIKNVVDDVLLITSPGAVTALIALILFMTLMSGVCLYIHAYVSNKVGQIIVLNLRNDLYSHILKLAPSYFSKISTPKVLSRMINDVEVIQGVLKSAATTIVKEVITIVVLLGVMLYRSVILTLASIFIIPLIIFLLYFFGKRLRRLSMRQLEQLGSLTDRFSQTLDNLRVVQAFNRESFERDRFCRENRTLFDRLMRSVKVTAMTSPIMDVIKGVGLAVVIAVSAHQVSSGSMSLGMVLSFGTALGLMYMPIKKLVNFNNQASAGAGALTRVLEVMDAMPDIADAKDAVALKSIKEGIRFDKVSLSYGEKCALSDISLDVRAGEIIALVGPSGAGKSSLMNLLLRFYDTTDGAVLIDGMNIKDITITSLRSQISWVSQENLLFNDTVRSNIAYGNPNATDEEIEDAARAARATEFIDRLPQKYETNIGEHGLSISGGERQRIAIARAFLKRAPVLILDEATSSIDTPTEKLIQDAISDLVKDRTTLVIAHRPSTITLADRIALLDKGRLLAIGDHSALLEQSELYRLLYKSHFRERG